MLSLDITHCVYNPVDKWQLVNVFRTFVDHSIVEIMYSVATHTKLTPINRSRKTTLRSSTGELVTWYATGTGCGLVSW